MTRRRHLHTAGRRVVSLDDDVLDLGAVDETRLIGEAALLSSLRRGRTGRMGDIVATIQADQVSPGEMPGDLKAILDSVPAAPWHTKEREELRAEARQSAMEEVFPPNERPAAL